MWSALAPETAENRHSRHATPHNPAPRTIRVACVLPFADLAGLPLADFPRVEAWHARLMEIPAWRDPFAGLDAPELPPVRTGARQVSH
jgi:glutathione S-transferase